MKKVFALLAAICIITMAATTKKSFTNVSESKKIEVMEKYKACIAACNESIKSSNKCESMCTMEKDPKMANCIKLCKESVVACKAAIKEMNVNSASVKSTSAACASACDKCATECEKFDNDHCRKSAADCRKASKLCKEM